MINSEQIKTVDQYRVFNEAKISHHGLTARPKTFSTERFIKFEYLHTMKSIELAKFQLDNHRPEKSDIHIDNYRKFKDNEHLNQSLKNTCTGWYLHVK